MLTTSQPLPITTLPGYTDPDIYTDGPSEDELLQLFRDTPPNKIEQRIHDILDNAPTWPERVHLSPQRHHLLDWFDFDSTGSLLEVGAGCGAMSGLFARRLAHVHALEPSTRRALILANRHRQCSNMNVLVGDLATMALQSQQYDYLALIGVLEYAGLTQQPASATDLSPWLITLQQANALLKQHGILLLAIENQLGLKYLAGYAEDHYGQPLIGIEDYLKNKGIRTFGKLELQGLLEASNFIVDRWYYPFPDYKLPTSIYSDEMPLGSIDHTSILFPTIDYAYPNNGYFAESRLAGVLQRNRVSSLFSNSFLVVCRKS